MKAILLDMYGVVLKQTGDDFVPYVQETFPELSHDEIYCHWLKANIGDLPGLDIWKNIGYTGDLEQIQKDYLDTQELNEGLLPFIAAMRGDYKIAVISNDVSEWNRYLRNKFELDKYFDAYNVSGDLRIKKPDPAIYRLTMEQLGVQPEDCVYVDDRRRNLDGAAALGIRPILFNSRNSSYDGETVYNFEELAALLLR